MDYADAGVCCTALEEAALAETFTAAAVNITTECADYYQQVCYDPNFGQFFTLRRLIILSC